MARDMKRKHHHQLESAQGCGSILPAVLDATHITTSLKPEGRRWCVLVVDDDEIILETTAELLEQENFQVVKASNGIEALKCFNADPAKFGVALMDIKMPGMDGDLATLEMLKIRPDFPVILMSGLSEHTARANLRGKVIAGFLKKPFSCESLLQVISAAPGFCS